MRPDLIRVVLVDDHQIVRAGLKAVLATARDIQVVGEGSHGRDALTLAERFDPHVIVMDLSMPEMDGLTATRALTGAAALRPAPDDAPPTRRVLVLTMHGEEPYATRSFAAGAKGYLTKDTASTALLAAVHKLAHGGVYVSTTMAERLARALQPRHEGPSHGLLTDREFEVMRLLVSGLRLTDIARRLHLSVKTISTHKSHIFEKMNLHSTAALVRYAMQHQLFAETGLEPATEAAQPGLTGAA